MVEQSDSPRAGSILSNIGGSASSILMLASSNVKSEKLRGVLMSVSLAVSVGKIITDSIKDYKRDNTFIIKIAKNDALYPVVQRWLIDDLPDHAKKNLLITSIGNHDPYPVSPNGDEPEEHKSSIMVSYNGDRTQNIFINGHTVKVYIEPVNKMSMGTIMQSNNGSLISSNLCIECHTLAAQTAVISRLREEAAKISDRRPNFKTATKWGDFRSASSVPHRPIDTVILKEGQSSRIVADLKSFLSKEEQYVKLGIPYHRGVLLHGEPGTGKTSIAAAISNELKLDVYYISLSSVADDNTLTDLLGYVRERSVLLLEDIDVAHASKARTDEGGGVTLSGLLNALDGFVTPHGLITIMTTNRLEVLDSALVRPGRIDISEEINAVDSYQVRELCRQFIGFVPEGLPPVQVSDGIVAAEIVEIFKHNLDDPTASAGAIVSLLTERVAKDNDHVNEEISEVSSNNL